MSLSEVISHLPRRTSIRSGVMAELVFFRPRVLEFQFHGEGEIRWYRPEHLSERAAHKSRRRVRRAVRRRALSPRAVAARLRFRIGVCYKTRQPPSRRTSREPPMRKWLLALFVSVMSCGASVAQFGGREGDAVILVVSAKGTRELQVVPRPVAGQVPGFEIRDPGDLPDEPFGPDFPGESRRLMHWDEGDVFNMIIQRADIKSPYQFVEGPVKVLIVKGLLRLFPPKGPPVDAPVGFYAPFPALVDFGPNQPLFDGVTLMWTPHPTFPVAKVAPPDYVSPVVPPGSNGIEFLLGRGSFLGIIPWIALRDLDPGGGWAHGIDAKLLEDDEDLSVTLQVFRLRPGRRTPFFRIDGSTHLWILSGRVWITPAGGAASEMRQDIYAFVPNGLVFQLSNPAEPTVR
jgi:hypothetical protein